ncbi:LysR family transcriptional regulator [Acetobacter senegalensis]|uniref:LysR family transcriptional regulator n=1 Tax=Acetobacter senegalensis TaxID=446692 RepID=UPI0020A20D04|nr:LysR family transcriptional regulator [Acetobacter senegalensis]MCP1196068.1 LysR family transcriptional regulator [Acetobacter senegalensis]
MSVFASIVREGSIAEAAAVHGISPAMAGKHLKALEKEIGTLLLHRTTRRQALTQAGESYYQRCLSILESVGQAATEARATEQEPAGLLRVTAPVSFGAEALTPLLPDFLATYPRVRVDLSLEDRSVNMTKETYDVAIRIGQPPASDVVALPLKPYRLILCAAPSYLAHRGTPLSPAALASHDCLAFRYAPSSSWHNTQSDVVPLDLSTGRLRIDNGHALRIAAINGAGVIMQPVTLLRRDIEDGRLVQLFPDLIMPERPMYVLYPSDRKTDPKVTLFATFIREQFA